MSVASQSALSIPPRVETSTDLHQELAPVLLDAARQVCREYSELAETHPENFQFTRGQLLAWYAEIRYMLHGSGNCASCHAPVRHVLHVASRRDAKTLLIYNCLCSRCLATEQDRALSLELWADFEAIPRTASLITRPESSWLV